jgi:hypothetical protein
MLRKRLAVFGATAVVVTTLSSLPADAAKKGKKRHPAYIPSSSSLDGRTLGRPRTCGFDYYQYDAWGVPMGPYCH